MATDDGLSCYLHVHVVFCLLFLWIPLIRCKCFSISPEYLLIPGVIEVNSCILQDISSSFKLSSDLEVKEKASEPDTQGWSHCINCGIVDGVIYAVSDAHQQQFGDKIDLSWSHWGEFFHKDNNDQLKAVISNNDQFSAKYIIRRPVYILPMLTLHVGHILIDLLEQVYFNMIETYGEVRRDALLVIDVASTEERAVLQEKLRLMSESPDTVGYLIQAALTDLPLLSMDTFHTLLGQVGGVVLEDLHVGLDTSRSHFQVGYRYHPCLISVTSGNWEADQLAVRYKMFSAYINSTARSLSLFDSTSSVPQNSEQQQQLVVTFIQRSRDRVLTNLELAVTRCRSMQMICADRQLESMDLAQQLWLFGETDILVATAGTALHNMMFMRPGSAVVVVMQPGWCQWAWMYANQAVLLGIRPFVYCDAASSDEDVSAPTDEVPDRRFFQWSRRFWRQGPRNSKASNITLSLSDLDSLLLAAKHAVKMGDMSITDEMCTGKPTETQIRRFNTVDVAAVDGVHTTSMVVATRPPRVAEVFVSAVTVQSVWIAGDRMWQVGVVGEIGLLSSARNEDVFVAEALPHLSVCLKVQPLDGPDQQASSDAPWCFPVQALNYYSSIHLSLPNPVYVLRLWAQVSPSGGKLQGSDTFMLVDCTLPSAGFVRNPPALHLLGSVSVHVQHDCLVSGKRVAQVVGFADEDDLSTTCTERLPAVTFSPRSSARTPLQRHTTDFCVHTAHLTDYNCGLFLAMVHRRIFLSQLATERNLPAVQQLPSPADPFVFLHIEKTGGTTMREFITESADALGLEYFVPCHGGVFCVTLELPPVNASEEVAGRMWNVSLVAGHFFWGVWDRLPAFVAARPHREQGVGHSDSQRRTPSCFVMGRHPVERAISYYYQRCYQLSSCVGYQRRINDLSAEELEFVALRERQADYAADKTTIVMLDEGMSNAACRSVAGLKATTGLVVDPTRPTPLPPDLAPQDTDLAVTNVKQCVVGLLERWDDTQQVLTAWFPWLDFSADRHRRKMHIYSGKETAQDLRLDLLAVLLELNACDMALYREMERLFESQLNVLNKVESSFG